MRVKKLISALAAICMMTLVTSCGNSGDADMVLVESGEFLMGKEPLSSSIDKAYYIDKFPVTSAEYKVFVAETKHREPRDVAIYGYNKETPEHPVVFVDYDDARSFCEWKGKRLPSEREWEKAARGTDGRIYPWGDDFDSSFANTSLSGVVGTTPVTRYDKGASTYGVMDMSGNAWEWTSTDYNEKTKVVKGGSWGLSHRFARTFSRIGYEGTSRINNLGFRCARDS
jgi:formylglycine-generating enzyme required for sulfatase activity